MWIACKVNITYKLLTKEQEACETRGVEYVTVKYPSPNIGY